MIACVADAVCIYLYVLHAEWPLSGPPFTHSLPSTHRNQVFLLSLGAPGRAVVLSLIFVAPARKAFVCIFRCGLYLSALALYSVCKSIPAPPTAQPSCEALGFGTDPDRAHPAAPAQVVLSVCVSSSGRLSGAFYFGAIC